MDKLTFSILFGTIREKRLEDDNVGGKGLKSKNKCQGDANFSCVGWKL